MRLSLALACASILLALNARATVYYWDPNGATAVTAPAGTWDTTSSQWAAGSYALTASPVAWLDGAAACFCAGTSATGTFTVELDTTVNTGGIFNGGLTPPGCNVTISGAGALNMGVDSAMDNGKSGVTTVAVPIIGTGNIVLEGTSPLYLHGTNTYSGGTKLGYNSGGTVLVYSGTVYFNNNASFGTGPMLMQASSQNYTLAAEGVSALLITNPWTSVVSENINFGGNSAGLILGGNWTLGTATPAIGITSNTVTIRGIMSGTGGISKYGTGTLALGGVNTYTGITTISNGSLAISAGGSISNSSRIIIYPGAAGSKLDVSALPAWGLGNATTLVALGTGTGTTTAAMIKGGSGSPGAPVDFGTRPIILNFTPTTFTGDATHPPLYITQGVLFLHNNAITVTNAASTRLGAGAYRLIQVTSANIMGSQNPTVSVVGTGIATNCVATISTAGGQVNLIVKPVPTFANLAITQTTAPAAGVQTVTLSGTISGAGPVYPAANETITANLNGAIATGNIIDSAGDFAITYNLSSIPYLPTNYPVTLSYTGDANLGGITNNTKVVANPFLSSDALANFFGGYNLITTNDSGLNMFAWSSTNPCLPVASWNLEGQMSEQPLSDVPGKSRYTWPANPTDPTTIYYIFGTTLTWPYASPTAAQWITVDQSQTQTFYATNVNISASGILDMPSAPVIVQQTTNLTVLAGKDVSLNVAATGTPTLSYQWYLNGSTVVPGAVSSSLQFPNVSADQDGSYSVVVSNQYGTATSVAATLTVLPPPQLATQVSSGALQLSATAVPGDSYCLQNTTSLTPPIQWTTIATNIADPSGLVQFTNNMTGGSNQFYRILCP